MRALAPEVRLFGHAEGNRPSFAACKGADALLDTKKFVGNHWKTVPQGLKPSPIALHGTADLSRRAVEAVPFVRRLFPRSLNASTYLLTFCLFGFSLYVEKQQGAVMGESKSDVLQGTLDLMVLKTLETMGPLHGYGIARRIEQVSGDTLSLNQGTIYPALLRLEQRGWIKSEWGTSETNRRAKFYSLSRIGRKQIEAATENWERIATTMARFLAPSN
jgi:PadR family transcriptional regulator, regulatory protein PadR